MQDCTDRLSELCMTTDSSAHQGHTLGGFSTTQKHAVPVCWSLLLTASCSKSVLHFTRMGVGVNECG